MTNNDVMRRLRFIFDFNDTKMVELFMHSGVEVTRQHISEWLKRDEEPDYVRCTDNEMAIFLNGLIIGKRGKKEGPQPVAEHQVNNNIILRKLKIALNYQADEMLDILSLANFRLSKHELSAFFRKQDHRHYRECKDQVLRNFLTGLQIKHRGSTAAE